MTVSRFAKQAIVKQQIFMTGMMKLKKLRLFELLLCMLAFIYGADAQQAQSFDVEQSIKICTAPIKLNRENPTLPPNDYYFGNLGNFSQWALKSSSPTAPEAILNLNYVEPFTKGHRGNGSIVAVLDMGLNLSHIDSGNLWRNSREKPSNTIDDDVNGYVNDINGWNFVNNNNDVSPPAIPVGLPILNSQKLKSSVDHGLNVASVLGFRTNNNKGMASIAPDVRLLPLRVGDITCTQMSGPVCTAYGTSVDIYSVISALKYVRGLAAKGQNIVAVNASFIFKITDTSPGSGATQLYNEFAALKQNRIMAAVGAGNVTGGVSIDLDNASTPFAIEHYYPQGFGYYPANSSIPQGVYPKLSNVIVAAGLVKPTLTSPNPTVDSLSYYGKNTTLLAVPAQSIRSAGRFDSACAPECIPAALIPQLNATCVAGCNINPGIAGCPSTCVFQPVNGEYVVKSGTSFAAPVVAGTIALMRSADPYQSVDSTRNILKSSCTKFDSLNSSIGCGGNLNIGLAVQKSLDLRCEGLLREAAELELIDDRDEKTNRWMELRQQLTPECLEKLADTDQNVRFLLQIEQGSSEECRPYVLRPWAFGGRDPKLFEEALTTLDEELGLSCYDPIFDSYKTVLESTERCHFEYQEYFEALNATLKGSCQEELLGCWYSEWPSPSLDGFIKNVDEMASDECRDRILSN